MFVEPILSGAIGVLVYVALLHSGTAFVSRGRLSASFGLLAGLGAFYVFFGMRTYLATDPAAYDTARFWHLNLAILLIPALAWFVQAYTRFPHRWPVVAFALVSLGVLLGLDLGWLGRPEGLEAVGRVELPWGEVVSRKGRAIERGGAFLNVVFLLLRIFVIWAVVYEFRRGRRLHAVLLALGIASFWIDSLLPAGGAWEAMPWDELGFTGLAVIMGIHLSTRAIVAERAERDLEISRERFRLLIERAPYGIFMYDAAEGRFTVVNPKGAELLEKPRDELLRASPKEVWAEAMGSGSAYPEILDRTYQEALRSEYADVEWGFTDPHGRARVWLVTMVRLPGTADPRVRIGITDVSELRLSEKRNRRLERELHAARRQEAVGRLAGGVAHDFNNLLNVIIGNLELLRGNEPGLGADGEELLGEALRAVERGSDLTRRLGTFARQSQHPEEMVDVEPLVVEVAKLIDRTLPSSVRLHTLVPRGVWKVHCQPGLLQDALINLCVNSRDALPRGGSVTIAVNNVTLNGGETTGRSVAPGDYVEVSVADDGEGMSPEVADRSLEPFFTTKGPGRGTGLGLSMVWGFVEQSGGGLDITSSEGAGTTVRMLLPRLRDGDETPNSNGDEPRTRPADD